MILFDDKPSSQWWKQSLLAMAERVQWFWENRLMKSSSSRMSVIRLSAID